MKNPVIYFRPGGIQDEEEFAAARKYFGVTMSRVSIPPGTLVVPRYSALPFYQELERDIKLLGSSLVNTYEQHRFVADLVEWYPLLEDLTPQTWTQWNALPVNCSFVVKGRTNSRKQHWDTQMFAETGADVRRLAKDLLNDDLLREQGLVVREYVPLVKLGEGINGMPISNEHRFFVLDGEVVANGFYWASHPECAARASDVGAWNLVAEVIGRVKDRIRFFVVDVAEKETGGWTVIELNDGQMSGLSMIDPDVFYRELKDRLVAGPRHRVAIGVGNLRGVKKLELFTDRRLAQPWEEGED